ncbi:MAG: hypothetical protein V1915_02565 [Candidatus Bathyarchaeota archaeon]
MTVKLVIDNVEIDMNEFVQNILSNTIIGAVSSLHEVKKDWKEIGIKVSR